MIKNKHRKQHARIYALIAVIATALVLLLSTGCSNVVDDNGKNSSASDYSTSNGTVNDASGTAHNPQSIQTVLDDKTGEPAPSKIANVHAGDLTEDMLTGTFELTRDDARRIASLPVQSRVEALNDALSGNDAFHMTLNDDGTFNVAMPYAMKRLAVAADVSDDEQGSDDHVRSSFYDDKTGISVLTYDTMTAAADGYANLVASNGADNVLIDCRVETSDMPSDGATSPLNAINVDTKASGTPSEYVGWGVKEMRLDGAEDALDGNSETMSVKVAVIDSGANVKHDAFKGVSIDSASGSFIDATSSDAPTSSDYTDNFGHGTMVSNVIASGTPDKVSLLILKAIGDDGSGSLIDTYYATCYAVDQGADVINFSLVSNLAEELDSEDKVDAAFEFFEKELYKATDNNCIIVSAAGNDGKNIDDVKTYPAYSDYSLTVTALDKGDTLAGYSNYGRGVKFSAPGTDIVMASNSDTTSTVTMQGTSFAAPHITALVADLKSIGHADDFSDAKDELSDMSTDLGDPGLDVKYGYGEPKLDDTSIDEMRGFRKADAGLAIGMQSGSGAYCVQDYNEPSYASYKKFGVLYSINGDSKAPSVSSGNSSPRYAERYYDGLASLSDDAKRKLACAVYAGYPFNGLSVYQGADSQSGSSPQLSDAEAYQATQIAIWRILNENGITGSESVLADASASSEQARKTADAIYDAVEKEHNNVELRIYNEAVILYRISVSGSNKLTFRYDKSSGVWTTSNLTLKASGCLGDVIATIPSNMNLVVEDGGSLRNGSTFKITSKDRPSDDASISFEGYQLQFPSDLKSLVPLSNGNVNAEEYQVYLDIPGNVKRLSVESYNMDVIVDDNNPIEDANETVSASASINWVNKSNIPAWDAGPVTMYLYSDVDGVWNPVEGKSITLDKSNGWSGTISGLPKKDANGKSISYFFRAQNETTGLHDTETYSYTQHVGIHGGGTAHYDLTYADNGTETVVTGSFYGVVDTALQVPDEGDNTNANTNVQPDGNENVNDNDNVNDNSNRNSTAGDEHDNGTQQNVNSSEDDNTVNMNGNDNLDTANTVNTDNDSLSSSNVTGDATGNNANESDESSLTRTGDSELIPVIIGALCATSLLVLLIFYVRRKRL